MTADREKILDRIRKLRVLAGDRAATPEEAMAAADAVRRIMAEHGLDQADIAAAEIAVENVELGRSRRQAIDALTPWVAHATGCVCVLRYDRGGIVAVYVGSDPAPAIAAYLHEVCYRAVERAASDFRLSLAYQRRRKPNTRAAALRVFKHAMIERLGSKLVALGWLKSAERQQLFDAYARRSGPLGRPSSNLKRPPQVARFGDARDSGDAAGRAIDINRPVAAGGDVKLIGG